MNQKHTAKNVKYCSWGQHSYTNQTLWNCTLRVSGVFIDMHWVCWGFSLWKHTGFPVTWRRWINNFIYSQCVCTCNFTIYVFLDKRSHNSFDCTPLYGLFPPKWGTMELFSYNNHRRNLYMSPPLFLTKVECIPTTFWSKLKIKLPKV